MNSYMIFLKTMIENLKICVIILQKKNLIKQSSELKLCEVAFFEGISK